jgi:hypothetical protein
MAADDPEALTGDTAGAGSSGSRAEKSLAAARKAFVREDWKETPQASFLLESAKVQALLELAEAIREKRS